MIDQEVSQIYYESAMYALAVGTPREVIQYAQLQFGDDDNFDAALGFQRALKTFNNNTKNCYVRIPYHVQYGLTDEYYDERENEEDEEL